MDKIQLGLFDVFVYILPGAFILIGVYFLQNIANICAIQIFEISKNYSAFQVFVILVVSFLLGFVNQYVAYKVFKSATKKFFFERMDNKETSIGKLEYKIAYIRHFSPDNFNVLHVWLALRGFCYSISFALLFNFFIIMLNLTINTNWNINDFVTLIICGISSILFFRRAITFHEWTHGTIDAAEKVVESLKKEMI